MTEQLAKAFHMLVKQDADRLGRAVAAGKAGAAGNNDRLGERVGDPGRKHGANLVNVILDDAAVSQQVPGAVQGLHQKLPGGVGVGVAGIRDGQDSNLQGDEGFVGFGVAHGISRKVRSIKDY